MVCQKTGLLRKAASVDLFHAFSDYMVIMPSVFLQQSLIGNFLHHLMAKNVFTSQFGGYGINDTLFLQQGKALFQTGCIPGKI